MSEALRVDVICLPLVQHREAPPRIREVWKAEHSAIPSQWCAGCFSHTSGLPAQRITLNSDFYTRHSKDVLAKLDADADQFISGLQRGSR